MTVPYHPGEVLIENRRGMVVDARVVAARQHA
jgi:hypothetical protein